MQPSFGAVASAVSGFNSEEINAYSAVSTPYGAVGASGSAVCGADSAVSHL